jgi:uncharacterized small protein (DUF1192 family)
VYEVEKLNSRIAYVLGFIGVMKDFAEKSEAKHVSFPADKLGDLMAVVKDCGDAIASLTEENNRLKKERKQKNEETGN